MLTWVQSQVIPGQLQVATMDQPKMLQKPFHTLCCSISVQFSEALQALRGLTLSSCDPVCIKEDKAKLQLVGQVC